MPQPSKFAAALAQLHQPDTPAPAKEPRKLSTKAQAKVMASPDAPGKTPPPPPPPRGRGRPPGKRSNPDFDPTTLLLRKDTKRAATRRLEDEGGDMDLSELVQDLLARWLRH